MTPNAQLYQVPGTALVIVRTLTAVAAGVELLTDYGELFFSHASLPTASHVRVTPMPPGGSGPLVAMWTMGISVAPSPAPMDVDVVPQSDEMEDTPYLQLSSRPSCGSAPSTQARNNSPHSLHIADTQAESTRMEDHSGPAERIINYTGECTTHTSSSTASHPTLSPLVYPPGGNGPLVPLVAIMNDDEEGRQRRTGTLTAERPARGFGSGGDMSDSEASVSSGWVGKGKGKGKRRSQGDLNGAGEPAQKRGKGPHQWWVNGGKGRGASQGSGGSSSSTGSGSSGSSSASQSNSSSTSNTGRNSDSISRDDSRKDSNSNRGSSSNQTKASDSRRGGTKRPAPNPSQPTKRQRNTIHRYYCPREPKPGEDAHDRKGEG